MKTILSTTLLIILSIGAGCQMSPEKKEVSLPVFDLGAAIGKHVSDTFTWNSIAKRITYVPVSSASNVILGSAQPVYIGKDFNCMVDHKTSTIFRTDKAGNIIHSFSRKGQGPGEYLMLTYVHVNPQESSIWVYDQKSNKYVIYDLEGSLKQEISLKEREINTPLLISDDYTVSVGQSDAAYKLYITDKDLNIRENLFPVDTSRTEMERLFLIRQQNYCRNRDRIIVHYVNEDTVYAVDRTGLQPLCIFRKGASKLPDDEACKPMEITPQGSPYIRSMWLSAIPGYFLITYMRENHLFYEVWSQKDQQIISRFSNEDGKWGLPLRLPSGQTVRIDTRRLYIKDNILAASIDASTAAEGKVAGVHEDDNPVLVVMEF